MTSALNDSSQCDLVWFAARLACGLIIGLISDDAARAAEAPRPPNVLFIMSDDHAAQAIGSYGSKINTTPQIDRIAAHGMRFANCFVTNSICTPSRAAILTGKYAHKNGVKNFDPLDQRQPTLPRLLHDAGYYTAVVGKWHLMTDPAGFDSWTILPGQGKYHDPEFLVPGGGRKQLRGYVTDLITDQAIAVVEGRPRDRPFFLLCHHKAPHDEWEYDGKHARLYQDAAIPQPATLFDAGEGRARALRLTEQKIGLQHTEFAAETGHLSGRARTEAQYQRFIKAYLRCVAAVDDNVGRLLDYLDRAGLAGETIVIYTSDQGCFLGEHGLYDKRFMYEEALRMPLLVRWPGKVASGTVSNDIVLNVDFAPTLLDCAGVAIPAAMQGRSFRPLLEGNRPHDWRTAMYYRYYFSHFNTEPHYGVRTLRWKLIHYNRLGEWELFDLKSDPSELHNLYPDAAYAAQVNELKATLARLRADLGDGEE
jgi:arylsulfatase A-like enzyme